MSTGPPDRWDRLEPLLDGAADLPPAERRSWLRSQTQDESLVHEVLGILAAGETHDDFLDPATGPAPAKPLPGPGDRVGDWELLREIGRGGMGVVCLARREGDGYEQLGVVKFPLSLQRGPTGHARFRRERNVLARLRHPNIAGLIDGGVLEDEHPYCVLEFAEGVPLDRYVTEQGLDAKAVVRLFLQLLDAVGYAHRNLVLHRDIKPSNVLVGPDGHIKLLDFGIAKLLDREDPGELTQAGPTPLTPRYASPEQIQGGVITTASDIYQLGVLLYDLLCGPRARGTTTDRHGTTRTTIDIVPTQVEGVRRGVSRDLDRIVLAAADPDPARRYGSVAELAADLRRWLDGRPVQVRTSSAGYRLTLFLRRNRAAVAVASVAVVALVTLGTASFLQLRSGKLAAERRATENEELVEFFTGVFASADPDAGGEARSVRDLVRSSLERIHTELADQPEARARLRLAAAQLAHNVGLEQEAEDALREVVAFHRSHPDGLANPSYHRALRIWAEEASRQQEYDRAAERYREWIDALEASDLAESRDAAEAWLGLAGVLALLRRGDEALEAMDRGEVLAERYDLEVPGATQVTRGRLLTQASRWEEAEAVFRAVIARDPTPAACQSYASLLRRLERPAEAVDQLRRAVGLAAASMGASHHNTILLRNQLARTHMENGESKAALDTLRTTLPLVRDTFGPDHWRVGSALTSLGLALADAEQTAEATARLREAWRHQAAALGEDHTWTLCAEFRYRTLALETGHGGVDDLERVVEAMARRIREHEDGLDRAVSVRSLERAAAVCRERAREDLAVRIEELVAGRTARVVDVTGSGR